MTLTKATRHFPTPQIKSMLVVEDNFDQQTIIQQMVNKTFPRTKLVLKTNGLQALTYLEQCFELDQSFPQLVLLDLYLPQREDGYKLLNEIRAMPAPFNRLPVVILSSSNESVDIRHAYEQKCTSYLAKPIFLEDWTSLFHTLKDYWDDTVSLPQIRMNLY